MCACLCLSDLSWRNSEECLRSLALESIQFQSHLSATCSEVEPRSKLLCLKNHESVNDDMVHKAVGRVFSTYAELGKCCLLIL